MDIVSARLRQAHPDFGDVTVLLAAGVGLDPEERTVVRWLSGVLGLIAGMVLLLACVNIANLLLARATVRGGESGVRVALGATRGDLVRQWLAESAILAGGATALSIPLVALCADILPTVLPESLSVSLAPDRNVYLPMAFVGLAATAAFGLTPLWTLARVGPGVRGRRDDSPSGTRVRDALVVVQIALSVGLVTGATLLGRSVVNAYGSDPGFDARGLVAGFVDLRATERYDEAAGLALADRLISLAEAQPGVISATVANQTPVVGGHARSTVRPAGRDDLAFEAEYIVVGRGYFRTMGLPLQRGRPFGDGAEEDRSVVVNTALVELFWPGTEAVGQELVGAQRWRVVGVVGDVQMRSLRTPPRPAVYYPISQAYDPGLALHIRSARGTPAAAEIIRGVVRTADPALPSPRIVDVRRGVLDSVSETRLVASLMTVFAVLAMALSTVGLYGVVAYGASRRVREVGIRIALGAHPRAVESLIVRRGLVLAGVGVVVGVGVSLALAGALRGLLFGLDGGMAGTILPTATVLTLAAATAAWLPARRATHTDVVSSLGKE